jgi:hypothetical protein
LTSKESSEIDQGIEDIFVTAAGWRTQQRRVGWGTVYSSLPWRFVQSAE